MKAGWKWIFILISFSVSIAQIDKVVEIKPEFLGDLKVAGFSLNAEKYIHIKAEGAGKDGHRSKFRNMMYDPNRMYAYAWILDAHTRNLVWRMTVDNTKRDLGTPANRTFEGDIRLPAGKYEVYYSARKPSYFSLEDGFFSLGKLLDKLLGEGDWDERELERWFVRIDNVDEVVSENSIRKFHQARKEQAVISITGLNNSDFQQEGFKLLSPGKFEIYAIGEAFRGENFDYGWIVNAENSEKVWETLVDKSEYAGGAIKNQMWRETISLDPGSYWVYFVMDDSHSPKKWNANPPYDPDFYGITVSGVEGEYDPGSIEKLVKFQVKPIVRLTRLGDDESVKQGFRINRPIQVRIYALGEGSQGEMNDYGWIENLETGEVVWEMRYNRTRHAGGARKNRMFDEVMTLPAGSYMVYFVTDGSHSYRDWNAAPPYNPSSWGITIFPADPQYRGEEIQKLEEAAKETNVLVQIIQVENGQNIQKRFELDKATRVRIYAIGEGDWDEMYDYGWIEDEKSGDVIWGMSYDKTRWAGGARKNRKVDTTLTLPPGQYILHYRSDDSHSFNNWNSDSPRDPFHYGITLYKIGDGK